MGSGLRGVCIGFKCVLPTKPQVGYVIGAMSCSEMRNPSLYDPTSLVRDKTLRGKKPYMPMVCETLPKCASGYHAFSGTKSLSGGEWLWHFQDEPKTYTSAGKQNSVEFFCPQEGAELQLRGCEKIPPECVGKTTCNAAALKKTHLKEGDFDICGMSCNEVVKRGRPKPFSADCAYSHPYLRQGKSQCAGTTFLIELHSDTNKD